MVFSMKNFSPSLMVPVLITPVNAMPQSKTSTMVMVTVPVVTVLKIQPTQVVTEEMVTVEKAVTPRDSAMVLQLSKNSNVVELIQIDSDFSITEVLNHAVEKLHTTQTNTIVVPVDSLALLEHALKIKNSSERL